MSGAARIHMQHFQVGRLAAPAVVMLTQLRSLGALDTLPVHATLFKNPALLLRALAALHRTETFAEGASLTARLSRLDPDWLDNLIRRAALHQALQDSPNHAFLLRHWYLTRRLALTAAALARATSYGDADNAAACAALLRAGMLVLEQQQSAAYALLTAGRWQQGPLLAAERERFQLDHVEAAVRLAESWQLDQFTCDALRYQTQALDQVLDAAPLVKLCWYANALANDAGKDAIQAGQDLLNLNAEQVRTMLTEVQGALDSECAALGIHGIERAPAGTTDLVHEIHEARQHELLLRQEISTDNLLAQHATGPANAPLAAQLARLLQDCGIDPVFIVLSANANKVLEVRASHRVQPEPAGLRIACAAGRNVLSTLILAGEAAVWTRDTPHLSVVDRQLLALLGGQTVLCEPLREDDRNAVLLLGMPASAVNAYLTQHTLRRFIARTLLARRDPEGGTHTLLLQQRIREAVHEANNPLAIIKNYLYVLGMKQGGGELPEEIRLIRSEIDRVAAILAELREPKSTDLRRPLALNKIVTSMHRLFAQAFRADGKHIAVKLELAPEEPTVVAGENALKQILVNLVKNAAEAMGDKGGTITLGTRTRIYLHDRFYAQISVRDDGPGIPMDLMLRLFKPGASTKGGAHAGSGLGIVRRLVEEMGGQIGCRSETRGTAMEILIPLTETDEPECLAP